MLADFYTLTNLRSTPKGDVVDITLDVVVKMLNSEQPISVNSPFSTTMLDDTQLLLDQLLEDQVDLLAQQAKEQKEFDRLFHENMMWEKKAVKFFSKLVRCHQRILLRDQFLRFCSLRGANLDSELLRKHISAPFAKALVDSETIPDDFTVVLGIILHIIQQNEFTRRPPIQAANKSLLTSFLLYKLNLSSKRIKEKILRNFYCDTIAGSNLGEGFKLIALVLLSRANITSGLPVNTDRKDCDNLLEFFDFQNLWEKKNHRLLKINKRPKNNKKSKNTKGKKQQSSPNSSLKQGSPSQSHFEDPVLQSFMTKLEQLGLLRCVSLKIDEFRFKNLNRPFLLEEIPLWLASLNNSIVCSF